MLDGRGVDEGRNLLAHLPQPSSTTTRPETCKVNAYAHGLFYRNDEEGLPRVMARRQAVSPFPFSSRSPVFDKDERIDDG